MLGMWGTLVVIAILMLFATTSPYLGVAGVVVLVPPLAYLVRRAATISIEADDRRVIVRNPYRTRVLSWDEIEAVEPSKRAFLYGNDVPAIRFRRSSGMSAYALAVPYRPYELDDVVRQLLSFAPAHVAIRSTRTR